MRGTWCKAGSRSETGPTPASGRAIAHAPLRQGRSIWRSLQGGGADGESHPLPRQVRTHPHRSRARASMPQKSACRAPQEGENLRGAQEAARRDTPGPPPPAPQPPKQRPCHPASPRPGQRLGAQPPKQHPAPPRRTRAPLHGNGTRPKQGWKSPERPSPT